MIHAEFNTATVLPVSSLSRRRSDVLNGALALRSRSQAWCQGSDARDAAGNRCDPSTSEAVAWCIMGAIDRAASGDLEASEAADELVHHVAANGGPIVSLSAINDDRLTTHEEIVGLMWKASLTSLMAGFA